MAEVLDDKGTVHANDLLKLFVARCSCGWVSEMEPTTSKAEAYVEFLAHLETCTPMEK